MTLRQREARTSANLLKCDDLQMAVTRGDLVPEMPPAESRQQSRRTGPLKMRRG